MVTHSDRRGAHAILATGRAAQAGWLLFVLFALSLALPRIAPYSQLLQTVCTGADCLIGQLTPAEAQVALAAGFWPSEYASAAIIFFLFTYTLLLLTAAALIWRKPTHGAAVCGAFALVALGTSPLAQAAARVVPTLELLARIIQLVQLVALLYFFCLIPDGHFHPGWLRWVVFAVVPAAALVVFGVVGPVAGLAIGMVIGALIIGTVIYRYRSLPASPQHEQVAWALAAIALLAGAQWIGRPISPLPLPATPLDAVPAGSFLMVPLLGMLLVVGALTCLAVSLLSDELFRVEVVLNRALVYSLLTLFVVGGYVLVVGYLSRVFQSSGSLWFSLVATGLVAVLFQSIRERVQRFVNQLLYGERDEPYTALARLGQRLEVAFEPSAILPSIVETVARTLNLPYVAIATVEHGELSVKSEWRTPDAVSSTLDASLITIPLIYQNEPLGELRASPRRGETTLAEVDRRLLADLAQQASAAVHGVRLMNDLRGLTADLQVSRERLVLAREEERRRIRNDLHDGLAPTLSSLQLQLGAVRNLMRQNSDQAETIINDLREDLRNATAEIRQLVNDLRPPMLDELGLVGAIKNFKFQGSGVSFEVNAPEPMPKLPAAVEVAVYRIASEAIHNVVKHAQATTCVVSIGISDRRLTLSVTDNGTSLPHQHTVGVGLHSMQERVAALGGTLAVQSCESGGTCLVARLPLDAQV